MNWTEPKKALWLNIVNRSPARGRVNDDDYVVEETEDEEESSSSEGVYTNEEDENKQQVDEDGDEEEDDEYTSGSASYQASRSSMEAPESQARQTGPRTRTAAGVAGASMSSSRGGTGSSAAVPPSRPRLIPEVVIPRVDTRVWAEAAHKRNLPRYSECLRWSMKQQLMSS